jgi:uncharacterized YigZ family protein
MRANITHHRSRVSTVLPLTLARPQSFEQEIRKSRFLARAAPVGSTAEAMAFIRDASDTGARHNCWAWRIGQDYRSHDGDEPSGTAGRPILAAIDGQGLDRVAVLVTRWFGGIKLGAGGLVRAYGGSAAECLRRGVKIEIIHMVTVLISCDFSHAGAVHALLGQFGASTVDQRYHAEGLHIEVSLPRERLRALEHALRDATRGQAQVGLPGDAT